MERDLFEKAPVPQAYLKLAVPVVLAMVLGVVYNFVDTWFISLTGDSNLVAFEAGLGTVFAIILFFVAPFLVRFFMSGPVVVEAGTSMIRFMQLSSILVGVTLVSTCVCQAVGNASGSLILSLSRQGIAFLAAIYVLSKLFGFNGILLAQPAADFLTGVVAIIIIRDILKKFF